MRLFLAVLRCLARDAEPVPLSVQEYPAARRPLMACWMASLMSSEGLIRRVSDSTSPVGMRRL
jgi:hypothetical protein